MAEAEQSDKNTSTPTPPHRRTYYNSRPGLSYRGRGRANASVSKALYLFGVRDLREILDRKHQDDEQTRNGPPPDPSYNYLKDPSRENAEEYQTQRYHKDQHPERIPGDSYQRGHSFRGYRGRGRGRGGGSYRDNRHHESEKPSFIENPINIKVEFVASTGVRNCSLDEETKIADIKHIPNYNLKDLRPKPETQTPGEVPDKFRNERGRGRWQRGRRGRGRGERGRGRGQGRHPNRNSETSNESQQPTIVDNAEAENWDKECTDAPEKTEEENEQEGGHEEDYAGDPEHEDDQEQYYEGEEEYVEVNEQNETLEGARATGPDEYVEVNEQNETLEAARATGPDEYVEVNEQNETVEEATGLDKIKLEKNLVVTSSENEEKGKRSVKFKLDDKQNDQTPKQVLKNEKVVEKESSQKEDDKKVEPASSGK